MEQVAKYSMELQWKSGINVSLPAVDAWMRANAGDQFCGQSADDDKLTLHFLEEPAQEDKDAIMAKWDSIDEDATEAQAYQSAEDLKAAASAKKASGRAKLAALGLDEDELKALLG